MRACAALQLLSGCFRLGTRAPARSSAVAARSKPPPPPCRRRRQPRRRCLPLHTAAAHLQGGQPGSLVLGEDARDQRQGHRRRLQGERQRGCAAVLAAAAAARRPCLHTHSLLLSSSSLHPSIHQELNVAVIKATTNQFHVVPKEKHVRSEWPHHQPTLDFFCFCASQQPAPCAVLSAAATASLPLAWVGLAGWQAPRHTCPPRSCPCWLTALACAAPAPRPPAALKQGVQSGRTHREVEHVISELHRRLHDATDWLVRFGGEDTRPASQLQPAHAGPSRAAPTA